MSNLNISAMHSFGARLTFNDFLTSGNSVKIGTIPKNSVLISTHIVNVTAFAPTTGGHSLLVGNPTAGDGVFVTAADYGEYTTGYYNSTSGRGLLTTVTDVYAKVTFGTTPTAGEFRVILEYFPPATNRHKENVFDT